MGTISSVLPGRKGLESLGFHRYLRGLSHYCQAGVGIPASHIVSSDTAMEMPHYSGAMMKDLTSS